MKNYKVIIYVFIGICISFLIQNQFNTNLHANNIDDYIISSKTNQVIGPDFTLASEKAIKSVVHVKSKYTSNQLYSYYDPFYGKKYEILEISNSSFEK